VEYEVSKMLEKVYTHPDEEKITEDRGCCCGLGGGHICFLIAKLLRQLLTFMVRVGAAAMRLFFFCGGNRHCSAGQKMKEAAQMPPPLCFPPCHASSASGAML
jgi:hypothetical protein